MEQRGKERGDEYLFNMDLFMIDAVEHGLQVCTTLERKHTGRQVLRVVL